MSEKAKAKVSKTINPMREISIEKVTINMGAGDDAIKLDNSKKIVETIIGKKVVVTKTDKRTTFGAPPKKPIGVKATLRGKGAEELLARLIESIENRIKPGNFDTNGNFSFGIAEYINIPGVSYDPDVGILGMDVCVTLQRPGFRVKKKRIRSSKVGKNQLITKEEAIKFAESKLGLKVTEEEE
jgi:large subunit ribosomal protein L5